MRGPRRWPARRCRSRDRARAQSGGVASIASIASRQPDVVALWPVPKASPASISMASGRTPTRARSWLPCTMKRPARIGGRAACEMATQLASGTASIVALPMRVPRCAERAIDARRWKVRARSRPRRRKPARSSSNSVTASGGGSITSPSRSRHGSSGIEIGDADAELEQRHHSFKRKTARVCPARLCTISRASRLRPTPSAPWRRGTPPSCWP